MRSPKEGRTKASKAAAAAAAGHSFYIHGGDSGREGGRAVRRGRTTINQPTWKSVGVRNATPSV